MVRLWLAALVSINVGRFRAISRGWRQTERLPIQLHAQREQARSCWAAKKVTVGGNCCPALSAEATAP